MYLKSFKMLGFESRLDPVDDPEQVTGVGRGHWGARGYADPAVVA